MYDAKRIEQEVQEYWEKNKIVEKLTKFNPKSKKKFYLLDGPPYANAEAHAGHFMTIAYKDVWGKFKKMQGYDVWFQPGFDCHGLPIEVKMRQKLGVRTKEDIEKFGIGEFIEACRDFSTANMNNWMDLYKKVGAWKGWLNPYFTYDNSYVESVWWTLKTIYEKGLLVQGKKPIHWCPTCETALAGYEATDEYADIEDPSIYIKFKIRGRDEYLLAWTTTPWTLPANIALLVHPDEAYVKAKSDDEVYILAKPLLESVMKRAKKKYKILEEFPGRSLEGLAYEPLLKVPVQEGLGEKAHRVYVSVPILKAKVASKVAEKKGTEAMEEFGHIVTMDAGTGIVHTAPGHGAEDNKIGNHYKLPILSPIDDRGRLMEGTGFEGKFVKDADTDIIKRLEKEGKLFHSEKIKHNYPLCSRCKSPLLFRLSEQWFITIDTLKENMLKANEEIKWMPWFAGKRMHNWIDNATDWCVSRQIFWGIPLPIWKCDSCQSVEVIGSKAELEKKKASKIKIDDLHRHVVDGIKIKCRCGSEMSRVKDTADVWLDSGTGAWASLGYPYKNKDLFEALWNVDIVNESQDQIRGWFYHLLFAGAAAFGERTINAACLNGWILDEKGEKMSKSKGNGILAWDIYKTMGADLGRLSYFTNAAPWDVIKYSLKAGKDLERYMLILLNLEKFVEMYDLDLSKKAKAALPETRWIISRMNSLVKDVTDDMENFRFHYVGKKLTDFLLHDFSRLYMKLIKNKVDSDKQEVSYTFRTVLSAYLKLLAPICPFITERIYQRLIHEKDSVHMESWPTVGEIDKDLERRFDLMDKIVEAANSIRQEREVGLRYPILSLAISGSQEMGKAVTEIEDAIRELTNSKGIRFGSEKIEVEVKPNYAELGKKYGKGVPKIVKSLQRHAEELAAGGDVEIEGHIVTRDDVIITEKATAEGKTFRSAYGPGLVQLDLTETQDILDESLVRELVRKVQETRKSRGMKISDKISLTLDTNHSNVVKRWEDAIMKDTGASSLEAGQATDGKAEYKGRVISFSFE